MDQVLLAATPALPAIMIITIPYLLEVKHDHFIFIVSESHYPHCYQWYFNSLFYRQSWSTEESYHLTL